MIDKGTRIIGKDRKFNKGILLIAIIIISVVYGSFKLTYSPEEIVSNVPEVISNEGYPTDNNLPIMVINTNNQIIKTEADNNPNPNGINDEFEEDNINLRKLMNPSPKYNASLKLYEPNNLGYTVIDGTVDPTVETNIVINTRGQSSLSFPKKQYTIAFKDDMGQKRPIEILGMPMHDKWVLNSSYSDKSLIRNHLAYKMAGQVMEYAPRTRYVEVYLNETNDEQISFDKHYIGVYILIEKIERDINRVNISRNEDKYKDISFIIARDKVKLGDPILDTYWGNLEEETVINEYGKASMRTVITTTYPGSSILTKKHEEDIIDYLNKFEYTLRSSYFNDAKKGYRSFIDVDSFAKFAMINEIFKNIDGGEVSTYFYKDIGGLMKAGPVWDFDLTLGNTTVDHVNEPTGFRMINTIWFERLFQDKYFYNVYSKILYPYYRSSNWKTAKIYKMIDEAVEELGPAALRNSKRWYRNYGEQEYMKEIDNMKTFLGVRLHWMDENIHLVKRLVENAIK